jgi:hypothetical protein
MLNNVNLFAPEFSHTYQSRNSGLAYLFKYGIPSAAGSDLPEHDADIRSHRNFGIWPHSYYRPSNYDDKRNVRWWELMTPLALQIFLNY